MGWGAVPCTGGYSPDTGPLRPQGRQESTLAMLRTGPNLRSGKTLGLVATGRSGGQRVRT